MPKFECRKTVLGRYNGQVGEGGNRAAELQTLGMLSNMKKKIFGYIVLVLAVRKNGWASAVSLNFCC